MSANVPELRFSGFADPWEQRKLGDLYRKCTEKNDGTYNTNSIISVAGMSYSPETRVTEQSYLGTYNVMRLGDIAFEGHANRVFSHGRFVENDLGIGIVSHIFDVFRPKVEYDLSYWRYAINNESLMRNVLIRSTKASTMMHNLVTSDFLKQSIPVPTVAEQKKIGGVLVRLDSLIALHQRKHNQLSVLKGSLLEGMFPKPGSDVPELRFSGFADPWEQRKLGDITRRVTRKNENLESQLPLTISAQYGLVDQTEFFNNRVASSDLSGYYLLHKGEFAYNKSTSGDSPWGAVKRLERYEKGCVSTLYIVFEALGINPQFLVTYYETDRWYKGVQAIAAEGARNHGLLNIAPSDFFDTELTVPSSEAEQRAVGALFSRLDSLIALHQRKLEKLRALKQSLLQKMFV